MKKLTTLVVSLAMFFGLSTAIQAVNIGVTFDDLNQQFLGAIGIEFDTNFDDSADFFITNNTGDIWTDFHLLESSPPVSQNIYGTEIYSGAGTATWTNVLDGATLDIVGLNVNDGDVFQFSLICTPNCNNFAGMIFYGYPTIDVGNGNTPSVPEPVTLLLLSTGLLGFGLLRRKREI